MASIPLAASLRMQTLPVLSVHSPPLEANYLIPQEAAIFPRGAGKTYLNQYILYIYGRWS